MGVLEKMAGDVTATFEDIDGIVDTVVLRPVTNLYFGMSRFVDRDMDYFGERP